MNCHLCVVLSSNNLGVVGHHTVEVTSMLISGGPVGSGLCKLSMESLPAVGWLPQIFCVESVGW